VSLYDQQPYLLFLKNERPGLRSVHSQVLQNITVRLDLAFQAFLRRVKAGDHPGYPRFRGLGRYHSLTYPQAPSGCKLVGDRLHLSKIGNVRVLLHRPLEGTPKTVTVGVSSTGKSHDLVDTGGEEVLPGSEWDGHTWSGSARCPLPTTLCPAG